MHSKFECICPYRTKHANKCSAVADRLRCRVGLLWPKVEDWNWETIFYGHYRSIFKHCKSNWPVKLSNSLKKCKITAKTPFKVIQGHRGRYQSKARMRLPISDKCKKRCLQKTVIGDVGAHPKPQRNHRFVRFVMYCSITTLPVACYWLLKI